MILLVDNYDSFTYNLVDYFHQLGEECMVVKNTIPITEIEGIVFDSVVLSPGPGIPERAGEMMKIIGRYHARKPILGICLGHQAVCEFFGGKVKHALRPMHGKISQIERTSEDLFKGTPEKFKVVRYHSLICSELPDCLEILANSAEGEIMAVKHTAFPVWGIQYHPEAALTEYGILVLENWLKASRRFD